MTNFLSITVSIILFATLDSARTIILLLSSQSASTMTQQSWIKWNLRRSSTSAICQTGLFATCVVLLVNLGITIVIPGLGEGAPPQETLTIKGCGRPLHQLLGLIGSQLSPTQQAGSSALCVLQRVGHRSRKQRRGKQKEEELPAMGCRANNTPTPEDKKKKTLAPPTAGATLHCASRTQSCQHSFKQRIVPCLTRKWYVLFSNNTECFSRIFESFWMEKIILDKS